MFGLPRRIQFSLAEHQSDRETLTLFRFATISPFLSPQFPSVLSFSFPLLAIFLSLPSHTINSSVVSRGLESILEKSTSAVPHTLLVYTVLGLKLVRLSPCFAVFSLPAGLSSSLSNPSIQASLNNCQLQSSLSNPSINSSLRLSSNSPRRRPAPISPLTLSPGAEQRRGLAKQLSPTMSPSLSPITQVHSPHTQV